MKQLFLFIFLVISIYADSSDKKYISTIYTSSDGLANNIVSSITQDRQGFLWIGTYGGLNRYDGKEFKTYTMSNGLAFDAVRSLYADPKENQIEDDIWIGTELGISILKRGKFLEDSKSKPFLDFFKEENVRAIHKTKKDIYLVGTVKNLYSIGKDNKVVEVKSFKGKQIQTIFIASNDSIWIGTKSDGLFVLDKDLNIISTFNELKKEILSIQEEILNSEGELEDRIIASYFDNSLYSYSLKNPEGSETKYIPSIQNFSKKGRYLICRNRIDQRNSYFSKIEESFLSEGAGYNEYKIGNINTCFIDREGTFWVGTYGSGLTKYYRRKVDSYTKINNLPNPNVRYIIKDKQGQLWIGTQFDIFNKVNEKFTALNDMQKKKRALDKVRAILEDDNGRIWFGSENGLLYLDGKKIKEIYTEGEKSGNIYSMDHFNGYLYVLEGKGNVFRIDLNDTKQVTTIPFKPEGEVPWRIVRSLDNKDLYLQTSKRILKLTKKNSKIEDNPTKSIVEQKKNEVQEADEIFTQILLKEDIKAEYNGEIEKLNKIQSFLPIEKDYFVFGDNKLFIKKGNEIKVKTQKDGLPEGQIVSIAKDDENNLWIGTSKGITNYKQKTDEIITFNRKDGLAGDFCNLNSVATDSEYAYFGTSEGLSKIEHGHSVKRDIEPNVYFTEFTTNINSNASDNFSNLSFNHSVNTITLDAATLSLVAPENNKYEFIHKFNGKEIAKSIQNSGKITYFNLEHGKHTFLVKGKNSDRISSKNEDQIEIQIAPPFWLDWKYMIPISILAFGFIYGIYALRVYQIKQENIKLEKLVQQRTKELFEEKETSERLLLNILPKNIAERLKNGESTIADSFVEVTVLFADIVGFTKLSQTVTPWELVAKLNDLFSRFDKISIDMNVEKIKTIGDCYMAVAGLPIVRKDHAFQMIEMAKQMLSAIDEFNLLYNTNLSMRIGMNTGEVVAGVIGTHKFIYDLWGDAVNTASRMESHGVPGRIHVTDSTYKILKDKYEFEPRGTLEIKGKGMMNTYLLKNYVTTIPLN